jgi:nucleotide-binding universal stress UspA family protein
LADNVVPRVVVGVDGSESGDIALRAALDEAARRGARLVVVSVWEPPEGRREPGEYDATSLDAGHERLVREHVRLVLRGYSTVEVPVEVHARSGPPADVLVDAARNAAVLVVGHGAQRATVAPVVVRCVLRAPCAVLVAPPVTAPDLGDADMPHGNVLPLTRPQRPQNGAG